MAVHKIGTRWYEDVSGRWFRNEPIQAGDSVVCITNSSSTFRRGDILEVASVELGAYEQEYVRRPGASRSEYEPIYWQNFYPKTGGVARSMKNWAKTEGKPVLAIESNDPCIVQEIKETIVDGKTVRENVGEGVRMDNMSAARTYVSNLIIQAVRNNEYGKQFEIYQRKSVARAKQPEIEFV